MLFFELSIIKVSWKNIKNIDNNKQISILEWFHD